MFDLHPQLGSVPIVAEVRVPALRHWISFEQGELATAERATRQLRRAAAEHDAVAHGVGLIVTSMVGAGLLLERGELEVAQGLMNEVRHDTEVNGRPVVLTMVERLQARLATARGDHDSAVAALAHARLVLAAPSDRVRAELALEDFRIAVALAPEEADALVPDLPDTAAAGLQRAALVLRRGNQASAGQILAQLEPATVRERIWWELLSALAAPPHHRDRAHAHLANALTIAKPHRYVTTVVQSGAGIADLLRSMPMTSALEEYVDELLAAAAAHQLHLDTAPKAAPNDLFTDRQYSVLRLLSSRLTTNEIAGTLYVSPNTLKTHMRTIYQKLQVNSRVDAVREAQARQLL